jgi:hypothetical protein
MKNVLSLILALVAIFSMNTAVAQNAKWNKGPCISGNTITGMATGLGEGPFQLRIQGQYDCVNKGNNTPSSPNWSNLDVTVPLQSKQQGGNFKLTATLQSQCDHANWTFLTRNLTCTLLQNGSEVIGATAVYPCN